MNRREKYLTYKNPPMEGDARATCHPEKKHYALGLCITCYDNHSHQKNYPQNKAKKIAYSRSYYATHREQARLREVSKKFGLSPNEYKAMLEKQKGLCAICEQPPKFRTYLCVDHCHSKHKARALLCVTCNAGLGQFYDNPELLEKAAAYLRWHSV